MLLKALQASQARIMAFLFSILIAVTFLGALMYVVEGDSWLHEYSTQYLLGNCDSVNCGLR